MFTTGVETLLHLTVHRDCVSRAVTHVRCYSYLYAFCLLLPLCYVGGEWWWRQ